MTTATETQPTMEIKTMMRHASDCNTQVSGWAGEICNCHPREYTEPTPTQPTITLSNFRVEYRAPRYEDGRVLYDGYCAILADSAEHEGRTVRVFDVPDADESQRAVAQFACEAMNQHERLIEVLDVARKMFDYIIELPQIEQAQTQAEQGTRMIGDFLADLTITAKEQTNGTR